MQEEEGGGQSGEWGVLDGKPRRSPGRWEMGGVRAEQAWPPPKVRFIGAGGRGQQRPASWGLRMKQGEDVVG